MFIRYLYLVRPGHEERSIAVREIEDGPVVDSDMHRRIFESQAGEDMMIWDLAVGCLTLSVKVCILSILNMLSAAYSNGKLHRDCWSPFVPIPNDEFQLLAPHELTYDDLEVRSPFFLLFSCPYRLHRLHRGSYSSRSRIASAIHLNRL